MFQYESREHRKCGRYEYVDGRSSKFWSLVPEMRDGEWTGFYRASWGRIGKPPQGEKVYGFSVAEKKLHEKIAKGYRKVEGLADFSATWDSSKKLDRLIDEVNEERSRNRKLPDFFEEFLKAGSEE